MTQDDGQTANPFDPTRWQPVPGFEDLTDITYHRNVEHGSNGARQTGTVRIAFDRPEVRNAFRPHTVDELYRALDHARMTSDVGAVLLTGNGPSPKDGGWAFCSGGDQRIRGAPAISTPGARPPRRWIRGARAGCTSWKCSASSALCQRW